MTSTVLLSPFGPRNESRGCMNRLKAVWCVRGTGRISLAHGALGSDDRAVELAPHLARSQGSRHSVLALMVNGPLSLFVSPELFNENCSVVSCRPVRRSVVFFSLAKRVYASACLCSIRCVLLMGVHRCMTRVVLR